LRQRQNPAKSTTYSCQGLPHRALAYDLHCLLHISPLMRLQEILMLLNRRTLLAQAAALSVIAGLSSPVQAQNWPTHPIRLVVPFAAGGANDLMARAAAEGASKVL